MNHYNYYTGEPLGSPVSFSSFTDPNERYQQLSQAQQQQVNGQIQIPGRVYSFGSAGYNSGIVNGAVGAPYMNRPFMNLPIAQQRPQYQDRIEHIDGFNPAGTNMLLPVNIQEMCDQLQLEMVEENEAAIVKRKSRIQGIFANNGIYGWNTDYPDQEVINKYRRKAMEIKNEAIRKRTELNKYFSQLAHHYTGEEISEEDMHIIYDGYDRKITATESMHNDKQRWLNNLKPYTNQSEYEKHFNQLREFYAKVSGDNMQSFLEGQGMIITCENLEQEMHNRRNMGLYYDTRSYKRLLRKSIMERDGIEMGHHTEGPISPMNLPQFSTLSQSSRLLDDGTLSISAPSWVGGGKSIQLNNEMEAHFEENRMKFLESIYAQDKGG